ncbi:hypothetical protein BQ8794_130012 [Mesorhizobium prunaredense]|uniref:Uncharacterized protein n=1 Tax=Mesorhizobium prunaredense TaxID=1631249 RepID=A0A1R3V104_9HYPH|nr:hypothetical protein BQ8794_130012 [Mesorhizobium prunaredense]
MASNDRPAVAVPGLHPALSFAIARSDLGPTFQGPKPNQGTFEAVRGCGAGAKTMPFSATELMQSEVLQCVSLKGFPRLV